MLVVAPDQNEIRFELIEGRAHLPDLRDHLFAVPASEGGAFVVAPFAPHDFGPAGRRPIALRQPGILEQTLQRDRSWYAAGESRIVGDAEAENFAHDGTVSISTREWGTGACHRMMLTAP